LTYSKSKIFSRRFTWEVVASMSNPAEKIQNVLAEVLRRISAVLGEKLIAIYLFGSSAREEAEPESDIDIFVLINDGNVRAYDDVLLDISVDISIENDCVISIMSDTKVDYDRMKAVKPFYKNIEKEGRKIYAS
jgi:uncharacterized protein